MSFIFPLFVCIVSVVRAEVRVSILWSESAPYAPHVQLTVDIPGQIAVTNFSAIDTYGAGPFFFRDSSFYTMRGSANPSPGVSGNLALLGSDMRWFGWEQMIEESPSHTIERMGHFDVSIHSAFLNIANTFMITPREFIINPLNPVNECEDSSSLTIVPGTVPGFGIDRWGFQIANTFVQIHSIHEMIFLTPQDDSRFVHEVLDALNANSIFIDRAPHRPWYPRYLNNCDMDLLDEILPILEFSVSENFKIHISPKEYIYPYNGPGADHHSCVLAISASTSGAKIGSGLFKRHAVHFDPFNRLLGICVARTG